MFWNLKLITNILAILHHSKMIDHKCKFVSDRFDLVLGDICWSVSVTDLDDGESAWKWNLGRIKNSLVDQVSAICQFQLKLVFFCMMLWYTKDLQVEWFRATSLIYFVDASNRKFLCQLMMFVDQWHWITCCSMAMLIFDHFMMGTLVVLELIKTLSIFFLEVTSLVYVHHPTLWCNIAQSTCVFLSLTETTTGPHWLSLPPHPLLKTLR